MAILLIFIAPVIWFLIFVWLCSGVSQNSNSRLSGFCAIGLMMYGVAALCSNKKICGSLNIEPWLLGPLTGVVAAFTVLDTVPIIALYLMAVLLIIAVIAWRCVGFRSFNARSIATCFAGTTVALWLALELGLTGLFYVHAYSEFGSEFSFQRRSALSMWANSNEGACFRTAHARLTSKRGNYHWSFRNLGWIPTRFP